MVAAGCADLVVECGLKPWDVQPLIPILEGAGGVITAWSGGRADAADNMVIASNPGLHACVIELLNQPRLRRGLVVQRVWCNASPAATCNVVAPRRVSSLSCSALHITRRTAPTTHYTAPTDHFSTCGSAARSAVRPGSSPLNMTGFAPSTAPIFALSLT